MVVWQTMLSLADPKDDNEGGDSPNFENEKYL